MINLHILSNFLNFTNSEKYTWERGLGHVQNSMWSFWPFVDIGTLAHFVVSRLPMLFLPKYIFVLR